MTSDGNKDAREGNRLFAWLIALLIVDSILKLSGYDGTLLRISLSVDANIKSEDSQNGDE